MNPMKIWRSVLKLGRVLSEAEARCSFYPLTSKLSDQDETEGIFEICDLIYNLVSVFPVKWKDICVHLS